jgi:hypothetical protein
MGTMGRYCKAYALAQLQDFPGWAEAAAPAETIENEGYLFLHTNYIVTANVFVDQDIVFDRVTPEWKAFCADTLGFEVPDYAREDVADEAVAK